MAREHYSDLLVLMAVAQERSFTRAASNLGMSQSMLSHTIRELEERLGVRLLTRTTRSVSVTEAGEKLLKVVIPRMRDIESELRSVAEAGSEPSGTIRFTASDHAIDTLLWPKLAEILPAYPKLRVELSVDYAFSDIVRGRYDFGVQLAEELGKDVAAVRIGPDLQFMIVAAPTYVSARGEPALPEDLLKHNCINLRTSTHGDLCVWQLMKGQREMNVNVGGSLIFNGFYQLVNAAVSGFGLAYVPEDLAMPHVETGRLLPVLKSWWCTFPGYHLFYARKRDKTKAMKVIIDALRTQR